MEYDRWLDSARKVAWIATALGIGAIVADRGSAVLVAPAVVGIFVATTMLARSRLSVGQFLALGWLAVAGLLTCVSAMMIAIARFEGLIDTSRLGWTVLLAIFVLSPFATVYSSKVWKRRLRHLQSELAGPECTKAFFFSRLREPSQTRFWASPSALAAMSGIAIFGSWVGYQYGDGSRAALVIGVISLAWIFLVGSGIAQLMLVRDYREVFSVRLV